MKIIVLAILLTFTSLLSAEKVDVVYSGIFTSSDIQKFPLYSKNRPLIDDAISSKLRELQNDTRLQFNLQFETNAELDKWDINDPYSLGILITRDDISIEDFTSKLSDGRIIKNVKSTIKVGMVLFAYQTVGREKKRNIVYTAQFVNYDTLVTPDRRLTPEEESGFFKSSMLGLFNRKVVPALTQFGVGTIIGQVTSYRSASNTAEISVGKVDGVEVGQRVLFGADQNDSSPYGVVESVEKKSAKVKVTVFDSEPQEIDKVIIRNLKGLSDEIYQVTEFSISSQKAQTFYDEHNYDIGEDIAQAFTDYLAVNRGKVVLPARTGSWITGSVEQAEAILVRDGESFSFALPKPSHPIKLTLSGLGNKVSEENAVSVITGFKGWLLCEIPSLEYSLESDFSVVKRSVKGVQEFSTFDVYYDLLLKLTAKSVEAIKL